MEEITLKIDGQTFSVKKNVLSTHSDYFKAMFSGVYVENEKQEISIDVIDADSMKIILQYMEAGQLDLSDFSLDTIGDLSISANFLQVTELSKQIASYLESQITVSNWMEIMIIAQNSCNNQLEQAAATFGLISFKNMTPEYIPSIQKLFWYLSHPYIHADSEWDIFKFGHMWTTLMDMGPDGYLILLGCLDLKRLTMTDLKNIQALLKENASCLGLKIVDCLIELCFATKDLTTSYLHGQKVVLCEMFTEKVYEEVVHLVSQSRSRINVYVPIVPVWRLRDRRPDDEIQFLHTFTIERGFHKWLEIAERKYWAWSVINWGPTKLVLVCGEFMRGTGKFMKDVKIYDTIERVWTNHGVTLPPRRHAGVAIIGDSLYIIGGVGGFRVVLDTGIIYDLKKKTYKPMARLPGAVQKPAVCAHNNTVFAAVEKTICRYDEGPEDRWTALFTTLNKMDCMCSFRSYIYCSQYFFPQFFRFNPDVDNSVHLVTSFLHPPATLCDLGDHLLAFTKSGEPENKLSVEKFAVLNDDCKTEVLWSNSKPDLSVNEYNGSCTLVIKKPPVHPEVSQYSKKYLVRYE